MEFENFRIDENNLSENKMLLRMRLQFFAKEGPGGEKTEEPTAKKLSDARKEGQVARSQELTTAAGLLSLFLILKIFLSWISNQLIEVFKKIYGQIEIIVNDTEISTVVYSEVLRSIIEDTLKILIPVMISSVLVAFVINVFQVKWELSLKPMQPKLSKFNPINGFKKIFSKDRLVELLKSFIKVIIIGALAYTTLRDKINLLFLLTDIKLETAVIEVGDIIIDLGLRISAFFIVVGLADYLYQRIKFKKEMMMTKQEIKDEFKQTEGDPQIKSRIRQKMRDASRRRMMQKLPEADVVITNPTHFACALKYDKEVSAAPVLIAKGADYVAEKIKEAARENFIPIVENKPLARMLYYNVDLDEEIPQELYQMAADVLAYVYNLKN